MKRRAFVFSVATLVMLVMASAVQAGAPSTSFSGTWWGYDVDPAFGGDGSTEHLVVKGGNSARVDWEDEFGAVCWDNGATDFWLATTLSGDVNGNTMTGTFKSAKCGRMALSWMKGQTMTWTFDSKGNSDPSDDTLFDGVVTWHRA